MDDRDIWFVDNILPKNEKPRKQRRNVKSVDVSSAFRKTKLAVCVLGCWAIFMPPYNIARLVALTRRAGYHTHSYDFNVDSYYVLKEANPKLSEAWNSSNYWWWQIEKEYLNRIHPTYEKILSKYVDTLLSTNPDIIGISTYYTNIHPTNWVVRELKRRRPDVTIVLGGPECNEKLYVPINEVDYYFIGESEQNILDFLENWENGIKPEKKAIGSLYSDTRINIDSLPYPDYSDFDLTRYLGKNSICAEISRGCIAKCSYCTEVYYWKYRDRDPIVVVDEIEYQVKKYNVDFISFVDSLMNGNLKQLRAICEEIIKRGIKIHWWGYARADGRMDLDYYKTLAAAGCQGFNYGIESGSDKVLKAVNKKNTVAEINQNLIDSEKAGMKVSACWVVGAPGEDIEAFNHSFNMFWNHRTRIMATSPGPGLGDNWGSAYDNREKFNINPRTKSWMGGWYSLDFTNTRLHRHIRIKLLHIWIELCNQFGGSITNIHGQKGINDHFIVKFDSNKVADTVKYETFNYNIVNSGLGVFEDSVMNEVFGFLRILWRVKGGYKINIAFNDELDHRDFIFCITTNTYSYNADLWFVIDDEGNYKADFEFEFINKDTKNIAGNGFNYNYNQSGRWFLSD